MRQLVVVDADVDVHAADHETAHHLLEVPLDRLVALLLRAPLLAPGRERMGRRRDEPQPVGTGDRGHGAAQPLQLRSGLAHRGAYAGADLDLALQELRGHLPFEQRLALREHLRRRLVDEAAGMRVDEQVFLFDPYGEAGLLHGGAAPRRPGRGTGMPMVARARARERAATTRVDEEFRGENPIAEAGAKCHFGPADNVSDFSLQFPARFPPRSRL